MSIEVDVQYALDGEMADGDPPSPERITAWIEAALKNRQSDAEVVVRIVGLDEGAHLNRTYRHKDGPTNVLSFPFESPPGVELPLLGDIVICAPVVRREAVDQGKPEEAHWAHLVLHGLLHLLGYDHLAPEEADEMEGLETVILTGLGYPDPYGPERVAG